MEETPKAEEVRQEKARLLERVCYLAMAGIDLIFGEGEKYHRGTKDAPIVRPSETLVREHQERLGLPPES